MTTNQPNPNDYPYYRQKLAADEEARRHGRHDSAATIKAAHIEDVRTQAVMPVPTKENEWLGFCASAIKLQNGDKKGALKKRTDYHDSFSASGVTTLTCSNKGCAFSGHISVDFLWKVVQTDNNLGLKCRWAFLAKSHLKQGLVTGRQYHFQCPICIYSWGHAEGRLWKGVEIYLEHISSHRGKEIPEEVRQKLNIINDHITDDKEEFDLNLFPTVFGRNAGSDPGSNETSKSNLSLSRAPTKNSIVDSIWSRKQSSANTNANMDIGSGMSRVSTLRSERSDSVVGGAIEEEAEPWSEGLSDFKGFKEEDYLSPDF